MTEPVPNPDIASRIVSWQAVHGRHDLPWQGSRDPYRIWLSEIMLQQTQVATVLGYYDRFLAKFPSVVALGEAEVGEVMALWSGLGYYSRARNLHRSAQIVTQEFGGRFPQDREALARLPGIGRSTAAAIAVFAFGCREAILDGNVKRVLCRHEAIAGVPDASATLRMLWQLAESSLPSTGIEAYTQGLMDLGATVCTRNRPACHECPLQESCRAFRDHRTAELPTRRRRAPLEQRRKTLLVLLRSTATVREVLLIQRPPVGIWGGLLSLPESDLAVDAALSAHLHEGALLISGASECAAGDTAVTLSASALPVIEHSFTHFHLRIEPLQVELGSFASRLQRRNDIRWLALDRLADAALPGPIKRLLTGLSG